MTGTKTKEKITLPSIQALFSSFIYSFGKLRDP